MIISQSLKRVFSLPALVLLGFGMGFILWSQPGDAQGLRRPQNLPLTPLVIETADGSQSFSVMVASSRRERMKGLMYRLKMADDHGMIFDYGQPHQIAMWMKNTFISLDMIFIRADGTISNIATRNKRHSLRSVPSDGPVAASLELTAGTVERLGIKPGDIVRHAILGNLED